MPSPSLHPLTAAVRAGDHAEIRRCLTDPPSAAACAQALWATLEVGALDQLLLILPVAGRVDPSLLKYALKKAAATGDADLVRNLLPLCGRKGEAEALQAAAAGDHAAVIRVLARRRTLLQVGNVLLEVIHAASADTIEALLAARVDHDHLGSALTAAAMSDRTAIVDLIAPRLTPEEVACFLDAILDLVANPLLSISGPLDGARQLARVTPLSHLQTLSPDRLARLPEAHARVEAATLEKELHPPEPTPMRRRM